MTALSGADGRLTPSAIWAYPFPPARFGKRGLEEAHVWEFCRLVEREIVRLSNERTSLTEEVQRLRQRAVVSPEAEAGIRPEDARAQAVTILSQAQEAADRCVADAKAYGRQLTDEARHLRDEILDEARSRAAELLEEARGQASLAEASLTQKGSDRAELEAELAYLRTFSDVYRAHLRSYLDQLVRNVEEWDRAEKESLVTVHADMSVPPEVPRLPPLPRVSQ